MAKTRSQYAFRTLRSVEAMVWRSPRSAISRFVVATVTCCRPASMAKFRSRGWV